MDEATFLDHRALSVSAPPQAGDSSFLFLLSPISTRVLSEIVLGCGGVRRFGRALGVNLMLGFCQ